MQLGSGSLIFATTPGLASCTNESDSREAWRSLDTGYADARLQALAWGILAPSPHNRQPWLVHLEDDPNVLSVYADPDRFLPQTDPFHRQIAVGLGAFVETVAIGASVESRAVTVDVLPEGANDVRLDDRPVARIRLEAGGTAPRDPLADFVATRRTHRTKFDSRAVPTGTLGRIGAEAGAAWGSTSEDSKVGALRKIALTAWHVETHTPRTHGESVNLTRIGRAEIAANPDGISLGGPAIGALNAAGIMTRDKLGRSGTRAFRLSHDFYADAIESAPTFGWLSSGTGGRAAQIAAGRAWMRLHLAATREGVAFHPLSQALQEFPEMSDIFARLHDTLGVQSPARIQGLFRLGYAKTPPPAPRWPLKTRLVEDRP